MGRALDRGSLPFTVEGRVLRELGERLVKEPEVAFVELIKNAHDADATECRVFVDFAGNRIVVSDSGQGMTLDQFKKGWMKIGTSAKANKVLSPRYKRPITGEKGIGRFAVRFLGSALTLRSVAFDPRRGFRTVLTADFDWPEFDRYEDLGRIRVPYALTRAERGDTLGTTLTITKLRPSVQGVDLARVRTASLSVVSPFSALLDELHNGKRPGKGRSDPGLTVIVEPPSEEDEDPDIAKSILTNAVLRARIELHSGRLKLNVFGKLSQKPLLKINDRFPNSIGDLSADLRFFPDRGGTFVDMPVKGPKARAWIRRHQGVAVFDRSFRVLPYGTPGDDWLELAADVARRSREPRSTLAAKHFPMTEAESVSTELNYMLRLPHPRQLVGIVRVQGSRGRGQDKGLVPAADREGFVHNSAFTQLWDVMRGCVEAIAHVDREVQLREQRRQDALRLKQLRAETRAAIKEIRENANIRPEDKKQIVERLTVTAELIQAQEERSRDVESKLEIMSLLGVVAGFMTHEFGVAMDELDKARKEILRLSSSQPDFHSVADRLKRSMEALNDFVTYTQAYVRGALSAPEKSYPARPRVLQVVRLLEKYAKDRFIQVDLDIPATLDAPLVPLSLYNGIALNLFTNALKAVTARAGKGDRRIVFSATNDNLTHELRVSDTGIGIPSALRERVFDPLFTTTGSNQDPLGSGLGLGLTLVKRAVEAYGGAVEVIEPLEGFSTTVLVQLPLRPVSENGTS